MKDNNKYTKDELLFLLDKIDKSEIDLPEQNIEQFLDIEIDNYRNKKKIERRGDLVMLLILFTALTFFIFMTYFTSKENKYLSKRVSDMEWTDSLFYEFMNVTVNDSTNQRSIRYRERNNKIITYLDLVNENDSLKRNISDLKNKNSTYRIKLSLTEKNYPISFIEKDNWISIESPTIDSALLLLPHYRHKLKYNAKEQTWSITP